MTVSIDYIPKIQSTKNYPLMLGWLDVLKHGAAQAIATRSTII
jgi:hypothetical protein